MIIPTLPVKVFVRAGDNAYAEPIYRRKPDELVCPVRLNFVSDNTTVRTDSAGSKGHARENVADVVLLATPKTEIRQESKVEVLSRQLRVVEVHPRYTVSGALDHYELRCTAWG